MLEFNGLARKLLIRNQGATAEMPASLSQVDRPLPEMTVKKEAAERVAYDVGLIMGSDSDWKTMEHAAETLKSLGISFSHKVVSAHRTPDDLFEYAEQAEAEGFRLIIAGAGGAAHLPGMTASKTLVPVIGVPVQVTPLNGLDALLSIMQMPAEVGVATVSVGETGAINAALFAAAILARENEQLTARLRARRAETEVYTNANATSGCRLGRQEIAILVEDESQSGIMQYAVTQLANLDIPHRIQDLQAGGPVEELEACVRRAEAEGVAAFIAGSTRGISLACNIAKRTILPVLGVPLVSSKIECIDGYLKPFLEMPAGVATFAINKAGAINAALFAATILSSPGTRVWNLLREQRDRQTDRVRRMILPSI